MEGLCQIAIAHYTVGSRSVQTLARNFFNAMDSNRDGQVSFAEFMAFMRQEGHAGMDNHSFYRALDLDRNGTLDFWEVMTLYYIIRSGRPFCNLCKLLVTGVYFTCVECFESPRGTFSLCINCYSSRNWNHNHNGRCHFLDNYTLLEVKKISAMNMNQQRRQTPLASNAIILAPHTITYFEPAANPGPSVSNALVPARRMSKWKAAFRAFETALSIGNLTTSTVSLCTIL